MQVHGSSSIRASGFMTSITPHHIADAVSYVGPAQSWSHYGPVSTSELRWRCNLSFHVVQKSELRMPARSQAA